MINEIAQILKDVKFKGEKVPVDYLFNDDDHETYIIYRFDSEEPILAADNQDYTIKYVYIDIYSQINYLSIIDEVKRRMKRAGFMIQHARTSPDMYETDTGYYHKSLCFASY